MKKNLAALFLSLAMMPAYAHANTASVEGAYQFTPDAYVIEDMNCSIDARVAGINNNYCVHEVPRLLFKNMCTTAPEQHHLDAKRRTCILRGFTA